MLESSVASVRSTSRLFISGPFGCGKSTLARERVHWLVEERRTAGDEVLVLVPQPINLAFYRSHFASGQSMAGPPVEVTTLATLARDAVELYWPQIAATAGFSSPEREPVYLNVEAVQYHLGAIVDDALERREFAGVSITRQRIILQIVNTLNRAALYGLSLEDAYDRLDALPGGKRSAAHLLALRAARDVTLLFRGECLAESLVDFSLLMQLFSRQILGDSKRCEHLRGRRRHVVADNMEEDNPVAHALIRKWAPSLDSLLVAVDEDASYRRMLGADAVGAERLADLCDEVLRLDDSLILPRPVKQLVHSFQRAIAGSGTRTTRPDSTSVTPHPSAPGGDDAQLESPSTFETPLRVPLDDSGRTFRYYPQMIAWVAREIRRLVDDQGADPGSVVIVAPTIGDALRFSLQHELDRLGVASSAHRPSRALLDEPATRCMLALAAFSHPAWKRPPVGEDLQHALLTGIRNLDPIRAALLASEVYRVRAGVGDLGEIGQTDRTVRRRISFGLSESYDLLREWLQRYRADPSPPPMDQFFSLLFEQILSRARYGFHENLDAMRAANQLVESARALRWSTEGTDEAGDAFGADYLDMVTSGVLGALRVPAWEPPQNAVLISPVSAFLIRNRAVDYQFWLDAGAMGWWERIYQPLTHIGVLNQAWPATRQWTDADEFEARQNSMRNLVTGLLRRTLRAAYVMITDYSESGYEQRGPLLNAVNRVLATQASPHSESRETNGPVTSL